MKLTFNGTAPKVLFAGAADDDNYFADYSRTVWVTGSSDGVSWSKTVNVPSDGNRSMDPPATMATGSLGKTVLVTENNAGNTLSVQLHRRLHLRRKSMRMLILAALACWSAFGQQSAIDTKKVDEVFADWDKPSSPGCALSVMKDGSIVYKRAYGMADLDHDVPLTTASVFHVASVSKQFTAASIVLLAQEGKLSLDDEARKYIHELPDFGVPITIRHLIHHTSGLRDQWSLLGLAGWRYSLDLITDDDVLQMMSRQKDLNFRPGDEHVYCNTGYTLVAAIVKRVSGQSLREFTTARIFSPLGMKNTHFRDDHAEIVKNQAYGYVPAKSTFRLSVTNFDTTGATSLMTTVEDLALWDENFYHPKVGGEAFLKQMLERGKLNDGRPLDYAFGLNRGVYKGLVTVEHSGSDAGYRANLMRFPEQHFSVACLCNLGATNPSALARKVADIYLVDLERSPVTSPAVTLAAEELSRYPGLYWNGEKGAVRKVLRSDGKLRLQSPGEGVVDMRPLGNDRFALPGSGAEIRFSAAGLTESTAVAPPVSYERSKEFRPTAAQLAEYAGEYRSAEIEAVYSLEAQSGKLVLKRLKAKPESLEPLAPDLFQVPMGTLRFLRDSEGRVSGMLLNAGRVRNFRFRRS